MGNRSAFQSEAAIMLPFRLTIGGNEYAVRVAAGTPGGPTAMYDADKRLITVRGNGTADDLVNNLNTALVLMQTHDAADRARDEHNALLGQVEDLARLVEAALPARHVVARRFWKAMDELTDNREPPIELLGDALDEFDALPLDERRRILNGWTPADPRPTLADVRASGDCTMNRVLEIGTGGRRLIADCGYRLDDAAGVHPVRVLLTEGVTKRQVLDSLREVIELVAADWDELVGSGVPDGEPIPAAVEWFHGRANEKGEASPMPDVPALAGNRNEEGAEAKPASARA